MKKLKRYQTKIGNFFPVVLEEDSTGGYVAICPLFEGCYTQGETIEAALKNIKEVIGICLEEMPRNKRALKFGEYSLHMVEIGQ